MKRRRIFAAIGVGLMLGGCVPASDFLTNPYLTLTETLGVSATGSDTDGSGSSSSSSETAFRLLMTVTFNNYHAEAELDTSFLAWVNIGSVRTASQQEALLNSGYVQLREEVQLGTAYTLPIGTYVYDGDGAASVTAIELPEATSSGTEQDAQVTPSTRSLTLVTPDAILVFSAPPVACDSVAFVFTAQGEPLPTEPSGTLGPPAGSNRQGGLKTLAQIDAYQCDPFQPGLFLHTGGGQLTANEYVEGDAITFNFFAVADAAGNAATVEISSP